MTEGVIPVSVKVTIKSANANHSILASFRGEEPLLCAIDDYGFNNPSSLTDNLILFKANHSGDLFSQLLGKLKYVSSSTLFLFLLSLHVFFDIQSVHKRCLSGIL